MFGEKYNLSKENELFISHGSLDTLNEELIDKNLNKNNRSIYATSNPEYNRPIKYDDGFNILDYVPNNQKPFLFENSILNNDESNKSKQNKQKRNVPNVQMVLEKIKNLDYVSMFKMYLFMNYYIQYYFRYHHHYHHYFPLYDIVWDIGCVLCHVKHLNLIRSYFSISIVFNMLRILHYIEFH